MLFCDRRKLASAPIITLVVAPSGAWVTRGRDDADVTPEYVAAT